MAKEITVAREGGANPINAVGGEGRSYKTSQGTLYYGTGNEIALQNGNGFFVGKLTSKGVEAQADRSSGFKKSEIADMIKAAHDEQSREDKKWHRGYHLPYSREDKATCCNKKASE